MAVSVVRQLLMDMRMARLPRQVTGPNQATPSDWMRAITTIFASEVGNRGNYKICPPLDAQFRKNMNVVTERWIHRPKLLKFLYSFRESMTTFGINYVDFAPRRSEEYMFVISMLPQPGFRPLVFQITL